MTDTVHILEQPATLYAMARAIQALAGLETLTDPYKADLGSFATHIAAVRQMLEEDYANSTTDAEKEMIADRLDEEANAIVTNLCEFPCPAQESAKASSTTSEAMVRVRYERMPLPHGAPWSWIDLAHHDRDACLGIISTAIRMQNPGVAGVDVLKLAEECLYEDCRFGMRPVPPHNAGTPTLETAAE